MAAYSLSEPPAALGDGHGITLRECSIVAVLALFRFKVGMIAALLGCSVVGVIIHLLGVI